MMQRILQISAALLALSASPGIAGEEHVCLTRNEQHQAVEHGQAVSLAAAIKAALSHGRGRQVVRAELCHDPKGLVYVLTVLARDGKVTHARVDAAKGGVIDEL